MIDQAEDVFFLTRAELDTRAPLQEWSSRRRDTWERQRRLLAPLTIGRPPRLLAKELLGAVDAVRTTGPTPQDAIVGQPASPGRATGPVRIIHGPGDFDRFQPGEVLVARATAPAWTPLFARASRSSPTAAPWPPTPPWSLASTASPPWSPPGMPPPAWTTARW